MPKTRLSKSFRVIDQDNDTEDPSSRSNDDEEDYSGKVFEGLTNAELVESLKDIGPREQQMTILADAKEASWFPWSKLFEDYVGLGGRKHAVDLWSHKAKLGYKNYLGTANLKEFTSD